MRTLRLSLVGPVIVVLLGGLGVTAMAQSESSEPTTPAFFEVVEETENGLVIVTTDPRFSGTWVQDEAVIAADGTPVPPGAPGLYPVGHGYDHVQSGPIRLENEEGAWQGWVSGFSWMDEVPWNEQRWFVGEGAYEGLSAYVASRCDQLPCGEGDTAFFGIIYEGDVPPLWGEPPAE